MVGSLRNTSETKPKNDSHITLLHKNLHLSGNWRFFNMSLKIGFLGSGKMAKAIILSILKSKISSPKDITCHDISEETLSSLKEETNVETTTDNKVVLANADIIFLGFKPQNFPDAITELSNDIKAHHIFISIMAGIKIDQLQHHLSPRIVRVMPNTACLIGEMAAGYTTGDELTSSDLENVEKILNAAGLAIQVNEEDMDAVTGLSGSGPAFVARLIEYMIDGGTKAGLDPSIARQLALKTFSGTTRLLEQWEMSPEELIKMVSSPNGTTVAGREVLENSQTKQTIEAMIVRATERSKELGQ